MNPSCMTRLVITGRRSRCLAFMEVASREIRAGGTLPTRPTVEEIIAVMREAGSSEDGARLRALMGNL